MIDVTLDDLDHLALPYRPDWSAAMTTTFRFESDRVSSLSGRQERRALGSTIRVRQELSYILDVAEAAEFRNALRTIQDTPVRLPFWPGFNLTSGPWGSKWWMGFDEGEGASAVSGVDWSETAGTQRVPTLLGLLTDSPEFRLIRPEVCSCTVSWQESSDADEALQLDAESWTAGPSVASITRYLFPFSPNWSQAQAHGQVRIEVRRDQLGFGRFWKSEAYPQVGARMPRFRFTLSNADAARLVRFFADRKGPVEPFWLPGYLAETSLAEDTDSGSADIEVTDATPLANFSYLAFVGAGGSIVTRKILSRAGNILTLESSPGTLVAAQTVLCSLVLVRFAGGEMTLRWQWPIAFADLAFAEVTEEYTSPTGDVLQTQQGDLPARAFVYEVEYGSTEIVRWTTWDAGLTSPSGGFDDGFDDGFERHRTYVAAAAEHGDLNDGPCWDRSTVTFKTRYSSDNPIARLLLGTATEAMKLTIKEVTPGTPWTDEVTLFVGQIMRASFDGAFIEAEAEMCGNALSRSIPRTLLQPSDNFALFDTLNGLDRVQWTFDARLTGISGTTLTFDTLSWPQGSLPTIGADYFALGYLERPAGDDFERILIVSSTALSGGALTVTLASALRTTPTTPETGWSLVPGYDGLPDTADTKFGNYSRFGGFPFVPASNPSIVPVKKDAASAGKK